MSKKTRLNWIVDAILLVSGLLALLTGIYFLLIPSGGYQGGRNPMYGITILFDRHTWRELHQWSGIAMLVVSGIHIILHWKWIKTMSKCVIKALLGKMSLSPKAWANLVTVGLITLSFLLAAVSGLVLLPSHIQGEANLLGESRRLAGRAALSLTYTSGALQTWDTLHTWSSIAMIALAVIHLIIHWSWVMRMTARFFGLNRHSQTAMGTSSGLETAGARSYQASHAAAGVER